MCEAGRAASLFGTPLDDEVPFAPLDVETGVAVALQEEDLASRDASGGTVGQPPDLPGDVGAGLVKFQAIVTLKGQDWTGQPQEATQDEFVEWSQGFQRALRDETAVVEMRGKHGDLALIPVRSIVCVQVLLGGRVA